MNKSIHNYLAGIAIIFLCINSANAKEVFSCKVLTSYSGNDEFVVYGDSESINGYRTFNYLEQTIENFIIKSIKYTDKGLTIEGVSTKIKYKYDDTTNISVLATTTLNNDLKSTFKEYWRLHADYENSTGNKKVRTIISHYAYLDKKIMYESHTTRLSCDLSGVNQDLINSLHEKYVPENFTSIRDYNRKVMTAAKKYYGKDKFTQDELNFIMQQEKQLEINNPADWTDSSLQGSKIRKDPKNKKTIDIKNNDKDEVDLDTGNFNQRNKNNPD